MNMVSELGLIFHSTLVDSYYLICFVAIIITFDLIEIHNFLVAWCRLFSVAYFSASSTTLAVMQT